MNKTYMIARLTKDAEIRYSGDMCIARLSIANDREYKKDNEPTADFYNAIAFGKQAQLIEKYAGTKGTQLGIEGRFQNNNWEKDGVKHYDYQLVISSITFVGSKGSNNASQETEDKPKDMKFMNISDEEVEELPFN